MLLRYFLLSLLYQITTITKTIMKVRENSTHEAIKKNGKISIFIKGMTFEDGTTFDPEFLYSIPEENEDDLTAIFDRFDEDNRCNLAEANGEFL